jgi:N-formylglutamate amidohydrolase
VALLASELERIKAELGYNVLTIGALPYVGHSQLFDSVVQPYLSAGASTTSSTSVTAASSATPVALTLASATGFSAGARVVVDVDDRQEVVTAQSLSGSTLTVLLTLAHSGTYPITVEGGETIVREILKRLRLIHAAIDDASSTAGIKQVDEIHFFGDALSSQTVILEKQLEMARDRLAAALGVPNLWRVRQGTSQSIALY